MFRKKEKNTETVIKEKNIETVAPNLMDNTVVSPAKRALKRNLIRNSDHMDKTMPSQSQPSQPSPARRVVSDRHVESMIETVISEPNKKRKNIEATQISQHSSSQNIEATYVSTPKVMQSNTNHEFELRKRVEALEVEVNYLRQELQKLKSKI